MTNKEDHIKKMFGEKLNRFEAQVPDALWSRIDDSLSQTTNISARPKSVNRGRIIQIGAAVAMVAALVTLIVLLDLGEKPTDQFVSPVAESVYHEKVEDASKANKISEESVAPSKRTSQYSQQLVALVSARRQNISRSLLLHNEHVSDALIVNEANENSISDKNSIPKSSESENTGTKKQLTKEEIAAAVAQFEQQAGNDPDMPKVATESGFSLSFGGRSNVALVNEVTKTSADGSPYLPPRLYNKKEEAPEMKHNQPVSFGLTVSKKINSRLSIETGVVYTYVSSRVKSRPNANLQINDSQNFHYLGVPLTLSYRFANLGKARFYLSAGAVAQKDFYGFHKGKHSFTDLLNTETYQKNKISQKNPQFSINSTLGASYPIYKDLRVYTTVGVAHYFDADNEYKTIFSDRKTQLDLNAGFRYEF